MLLFFEGTTLSLDGGLWQQHLAALVENQGVSGVAVPTHPCRAELLSLYSCRWAPRIRVSGPLPAAVTSLERGLLCADF